MISLLLRGQRPTSTQLMAFIMSAILYVIAFTLMHEEFYKEIIIGVLFMTGASIMDSADDVS